MILPDWPKRLRWSSKPLEPGKWIPGASDTGSSVRKIRVSFISPSLPMASTRKRPGNLPIFRIRTLLRQAGSGLPAQVGDPANSPEPYNWPLKAGMWAGWYISGLHAALGGSFALIHRQNTGEGQMVDVATMDAYPAWLDSRQRLAIRGRQPGRESGFWILFSTRMVAGNVKMVLWSLPHRGITISEPF